MALKCHVCGKAPITWRKDVVLSLKWSNKLFGNECEDANDGGILIDFENNSKEKVSCLHFTDGQRSWRGIVEGEIKPKCFYHGSKVIKSF